MEKIGEEPLATALRNCTRPNPPAFFVTHPNRRNPPGLAGSTRSNLSTERKRKKTRVCFSLLNLTSEYRYRFQSRIGKPRRRERDLGPKKRKSLGSENDKQQRARKASFWSMYTMKIVPVVKWIDINICKPGYQLRNSLPFGSSSYVSAICGRPVAGLHDICTGGTTAVVELHESCTGGGRYPEWYECGTGEDGMIW
ncbi:hypothetical protein OSB04_012281 [Centaurea solstitialis]|uniref:Uncharacterized protein n=1 Tax=Centaurea solstitialis TaxID=347529 RepID=A0AA38TU55_9ASTR|nr:hypothetical protein OSB04_012281 [Centaurea solstitialis]